VSVRGPQTDGTVITGAVHLSPAARTSVGPSPAVYVGLFRRRAAHGVPVAGTLMGPEGYFILMDVPPGAFWLLVSVLASRADAPGQLVPVTQVVGAASMPVLVPERPVSLVRDVSVDVAPDWFAPVLVALPPLAAV
jgi:AraC family transcriptional regulator